MKPRQQGLSSSALKQLWSPWRMSYLTTLSKKNACFLCAAAKTKHDRVHGVFARSPHSFAILNIYPYNNGHVMIVPRRHVSDLRLLSDDERNDLFSLLMTVQTALTAVLHPEGFNIGMNIGDVAGAGVKDHIHLHIVPRWKGDTNFMPVCAGTKIISQSLSALYKGLQHALQRGIRRKRT